MNTQKLPLIIALLALVVGLVALSFTFQSDKVGAVGEKLIENYLPYVKYNSGIYSALGITTTDTITGGDLVSTDDLTVADDSTLTGDLSVSGVTVVDEFTQGGGILATTTANNAETMLIANMATYNWFRFSQTGAAAITYTLPATSTWTTVIPTAGDMREWLFENASTTSVLTFAAGTGIDLIAVTNADDVIDGSEYSRLTCYRQADTDVTCIISELLAAD